MPSERLLARPATHPPSLQLWSFTGELLATLAGAALPAAAGAATIYVSERQEAMCVACPPAKSRTPAAAAPSAPGEAAAASEPGSLGCVRVYSLLSGQQAAMVRPLPFAGPDASPAEKRESIQRSVQAAAVLHRVTALFYDQHTHRLLTGTVDGTVQAWGVL